MLTRDFTCSRNLSQEFVAVVIARENLTPLFSTDVNKLWKAGPFIFVFQASGVMPVSGASCFPLAPRARPSGNAGPRTAAIRQRGIVADWTAWSKRKVCEGPHRGAHPLHSF